MLRIAIKRRSRGEDKEEVALHFVLMPKKLCKKREGGCGKPFHPRNIMQSMCSPQCAENHVRAKREKAEAKLKRENHIQTRADKEALKTLPGLTREVSFWLHKFVRLRDKARGCISCGERFTEETRGGAYDAGHFRSIGSAPHLRFDIRNIHGQCKHCNQYLSGNILAYEKALRARYDDKMVDELLADQEPRKYTRDDLRDLREFWKAKVKIALKHGINDERTNDQHQAPERSNHCKA